MIKNLLLLLLLCVSIRVVAQNKISLHTDFDMYFDNKEFAATNYAVQGLDYDSGTDFFGRLHLAVDFALDKNNSLVVGADMSNNYGENITTFFSNATPLIYYRYKSDRAKYIAGIFHNTEMHLDSYSTAFYSTTSRVVDNRISGVLAQLNREDSFFEVALNWNGEYSETSREKFEVLSAARHHLGWFYYGYNYLMYHYAKGMSDDAQGVIDLQKINPCVGFRFGGELGVDIKAGAIVAPQRNRSYGNEWLMPVMGEVTIALNYKGFALTESLYFGDNINPFFEGQTLDDGTYIEYGRDLYPSESFFRTDRGIYNRAAVAYERTFMKDILKLRAEVATHYDGYGLGTQYILRVGVNLFTTLYQCKTNN